MSRKGIISALHAKYDADIAMADATINIYLDNPVGIGEHPQHLEEMDKLVSAIESAESKLSALNRHFNNTQI